MKKYLKKKATKYFTQGNLFTVVKKIYSDTLEKLVLKEKGEYGLKVLHDSRENNK